MIGYSNMMLFAGSLGRKESDTYDELMAQFSKWFISNYHIHDAWYQTIMNGYNDIFLFS